MVSANGRLVDFISEMGETGRKIVVESYGGMSRVGGGCFSGKDPTKVDKSGVYGARFIAKNVIAAYGHFGRNSFPWKNKPC